MCRAIQVWRIRRTALSPVIYWFGVVVVSVQEVFRCSYSIPDHRHKGDNKEDPSCIHDTGWEDWLRRQIRTTSAAVPPSVHLVPEWLGWQNANACRSAPDIFCRVTLMRADWLEGLASPAWHWRRGIEETPTGRSLPVATREYFDACFCHIMTHALIRSLYCRSTLYLRL